MSLLLPTNYHAIPHIEHNDIVQWTPLGQNNDSSNHLRIGILNIMPLGHEYELNILNSLGFTTYEVEPIWIKLKSHTYKTWPEGYVDREYITYEQAKDQGRLDGLIITGAPVEHLRFEEVTYWREIVNIINDSRDNCPSTLGLCWAGMAMAHLVGVKKNVFEKKLFGVFELENQISNHVIMGASDDKFVCPQSRNAGMDDIDMQRAESRGDLNLLAYGEEAGYTIYETPDHKQLIHIGHPEYNSGRLAYEARRDSTDPAVPPISNFDFENPANVWKMHRHTFYQQWLNYCHRTLQNTI
ncbi:MAG: homoserine O-succinyltransferase [Chloroflexi bacterium]|nr:homoserine O-succinyltransferase [Chloroflexota bacterium]